MSSSAHDPSRPPTRPTGLPAGSLLSAQNCFMRTFIYALVSGRVLTLGSGKVIEALCFHPQTGQGMFHCGLEWEADVMARYGKPKATSLPATGVWGGSIHRPGFHVSRPCVRTLSPSPSAAPQSSDCLACRSPTHRDADGEHSLVRLQVGETLFKAADGLGSGWGGGLLLVMVLMVVVALLSAQSRCFLEALTRCHPPPLVPHGLPWTAPQERVLCVSAKTRRH